MDPRVPLYYKIESELKNRIFSGHYKSGDILPSERELIDMYKVSRLTEKSRGKEHLWQHRNLTVEWVLCIVVEKKF